MFVLKIELVLADGLANIFVLKGPPEPPKGVVFVCALLLNKGKPVWLLAVDVVLNWFPILNGVLDTVVLGLFREELNIFDELFKSKPLLGWPKMLVV